ncbi:hypothetical protein QYG89_16260 [Bacillus sp. B190/17]|uniref:Uncharacterized protein n=1 Tax=Bacillus lumedeiriae TaxID=3058829 RepID=A0ABW8ICD7_9BACI
MHKSKTGLEENLIKIKDNDFSTAVLQIREVDSKEIAAVIFLIWRSSHVNHLYQ